MNDLLLQDIRDYLSGSSGMSTKKELINRIDKHLDTGGWIPVAERLPEMGEQVMVAVKDFGIGTDCYGDSPTWENFGDDVTHWQPLPPLPKGE